MRKKGIYGATLHNGAELKGEFEKITGKKKNGKNR